MSPGLLAALVIFFLFSACQSRPQSGSQEIPRPAQPVPESREILDHLGPGRGPVPAWAERYLSGGIRLVEEMPEFSDRQLFMGEDEGTSFAALERRLAEFEPDAALPQLVAVRVMRRLSVLGGNSPSTDYSRWLEGVLRAVADSPWSGARIEGICWFLAGYAPENEAGQGRESRLLLVLLSVEREGFRGRLDSLLWRQQEYSGGEREQNAALRRLRNIFYEGF